MGVGDARHRDSSCRGAFFDLLGGPPICLVRLHPLEVADDHTTCVRKNVGNDQDSVPAKDGVRVRSCRTVCALHNDLRLDAVRIVRRDHTFHSAGQEHVDVKFEKVARLYFVGIPEASDGARRRDVSFQRWDIQAPSSMDRTVLVAHCHDPRSRFFESLSSHGLADMNDPTGSTGRIKPCSSDANHRDALSSCRPQSPVHRRRWRRATQIPQPPSAGGTTSSTESSRRTTDM